MTILPPNSTELEQAVDGTQAVRIEGIEVPIRHLWNPDLCPEAVLPWLAWALSVDEWDPSWSVTQKRQVIKNSPIVHRHKGTRGALEAALESLGYEVTVIEWWEKEPEGTRGTFDLNILIPAGYAVSPDTYDEVERVALKAKNRRSHIGTIQLTPAGLSQVPTFSAAVIGGCTTTVYPLGRIGIGDDV
ncbi:MAG: phage tail protein I [Desulfobacterales bacterium]|nr:phage tail protein I [Desulfobacterales bacterium]